MDIDQLLRVPGYGSLVDIGGLGVQFKIRGEQTRGAFAVVEHPIPPGLIVEPHRHRDEDELSYVVEGVLWARVGDHEFELHPGAYLWKPRGILHTFWNPGPAPGRIVETISPAGFERFFEQLAELLRQSPPPDEDVVYELCERFGLSFDRRWLPEIEERFGPMRMV